jgi:hypothetical protein
MTDAMPTARLTTWADLLLGVAVRHGPRVHSLWTLVILMWEP